MQLVNLWPVSNKKFDIFYRLSSESYSELIYVSDISIKQIMFSLE